MSENYEKRELEEYINLAQCDFKLIENAIREINANKSRSFNIINVQWKCKREIDAKCVLDKFFEETEKKQKYTSMSWENFEDWKKKEGPDFDDSKGDSPFLRAVYYYLWGKRIINLESDYENGWGNFSTSYLFQKELWGGDTINTIWSYQESVKQYIKDDKEDEKKVNQLCGTCHTLGNFVLVPAYFNGWRGIVLEVHDRFDISLAKLKEKKTDEIFKSKVKPYKRDKNFEVCGDFKKYINVFFLWDYVYKDGKEYGIIDLTKKFQKKNNRLETERKEPEKKGEISNIDNYVTNVTAIIKRRSIFMAGLLKIAYEFHTENDDLRNEWKASNEYQNIMKKVLCADRAYSGYDDVIEKICEEVDNQEVLNILGQITEKIKKIEI